MAQVVVLVGCHRVLSCQPHLGPGTLPHTDDTVLVWVEDLAHLAHWLRVSGGRGEVSVEVQAAKQAAPAIVAVGRVGEAPWHQGLALHQGARCVYVCVCV